VNLIDGDHFCTENLVMTRLSERLREAFPGIDFSIAECHKQTVQYY